MKKIITKYAAYIIIAVMLATLIPGLANRITNEGKNDNVTISVLYNQMISTISKAKLNAALDEFKAMGVNTVSVMEEDINGMVNRGDVTSIRYHALRHKYDDESMRLADFVAEKCPDVTYHSHIVIASREEAKKQLAYSMPRKFDDKDYCDVGEFEDLYVYVLYDGNRQLYDYTIGYNESSIEMLKNKGFNIALVYKVYDYARLEYVEDIERIVKEYDVEYLNLKKAPESEKESPNEEKHYTRLTSIINDNNMTLVVTENTDQLSNQKFLGYDHVFSGVMGDGGTKKVVRSYETHDDSHQDSSKYKYRAEQFLNSTIDRNMRFITVRPQVLNNTSSEDCIDYTIKAVRTYKDKIQSLGYSVNGETSPLDYKAHHTVNAAACAVIMVMCLYLMIVMVSGKESFILAVSAIVFAFLGAVGTAIIPDSLVMLYPTVFCVFQSCMAVTAMLYFVKVWKDKLSYWILAPAALCIMLGVLFLGSIGMGAMLSGIEYYVNNVIFRGIKISLIIPVAYSAFAYYMMFVKSDEHLSLSGLKKLMDANIKVYWVLIALVVGAVGAYYLIRSGNVNSISGAEKLLRSTVTEIFPARPRTKEFLIGYPALILFIYYVKNSDIQLIKWLLAIAASILAASVTNSFCHIFTDYTTIVTRTLNGLIVGIMVSVVAFVANLVLIKILKFAKKSLEI